MRSAWEGGTTASSRPWKKITGQERRSTAWIGEHCHLDTRTRSWLEKLPGPYTLILKLKARNDVAPSTLNGLQTMGVRIPDHWFTSYVEKLGVPVVTTSANLTGENHMTRLEDLDPVIKRKVDFIIYEGEKRSRPSTLVDLSSDGEKIIKR